MNNLPAMTDSHRQGLIADCNLDILKLTLLIEAREKQGINDIESKSALERQKIALAALTAEPHYHTMVGNYYTAPPAPVLKRNNEKLAREIVCRLVDVGEADPEVVGIHQAWVLNKLNGVN